MMRGARGAAKRRGSLIATVLAGSWRDGTPAVEISPGDLSAITPVLLSSAGGALAWQRIRGTPHEHSRFGREILQAYRLHSLQAALHDRQLTQLVSCLNAAGVVYALGKGWAVARSYPEPGLRPYGDFDLYVHEKDYADALSALRAPGVMGIPVDLHKGLAELDDRPPDEVRARCRTAGCGEVQTTIFAPEDHLRLLCLHMMRHGAWRPIWLCDVAVVLERDAREFDWEYFLRGESARTAWVLAALALARELLGAGMDSKGIDATSRPMPRWLVPAVLSTWGSPPVPHGLRTPMRSYLRQPAAFARALLERWPGPIESTVGVGAALNNLPRLPYQLAECISRIARFTLQLPAHRRPEGGT